MTTSRMLLEIEDLDVNYGDFQALRNISLEVREGSVVSIIGANGAGKSTLLQTISGLIKPLNGKIRFHGKDITKYEPHQAVAEGISMVPEGGRVFSGLTVLDNLVIGSYTSRARKKKNQSLKKVYELFPILADKANQLAGNLSGGQRQMLAIGRSLMSEPKLVLFDEISLGLAPTVIKDIYQQIRLINEEGTTVILVEQDVKRSLKASETSNVMLKGSIVLSGCSTDLSEESVRQAYFGI